MAEAAAPPGEFFRYLDPVTETAIVRLTSPATVSLFPAPQNRFVSRRGHFLIFSSNRTGKFVPFRLDLRTATLQQLADPGHLDPRSLTLDPSERRLLFLDGTTICEVTLSTKRTRTLRENVDAFRLANSGELFFLAQGRLQTSSGETLARDAAWPIEPAVQSNGCFFMRQSGEENGLWWAPLKKNATAASAAPKLLASGNISDPFADEDAVLYLQRQGRATEIRQSTVAGASSLIAPGTQLDSFSPNQDATVFVGASRSKAQPFIVLILRANRRELALCEHHASPGCKVTPVFSPDSRRVYFESDRHGKPALYSVNVESLVEPT